MACGGENDVVRIKPRRFRCDFGEPGGGDGEVEELEDGRSLAARKGAGYAADVVRRDSALFVGGARERDQGVLSGDVVLHLHGVAYGVNIAIAGSHMLVHLDGSAHA